MGWLLCLCYLAAEVAVAIGSERQQHQVQHGPCRYTFILPEVEQCRPAGDFQVTNSLQRDSPSAPESPHTEPNWQEKKLETLESATENNTQWLQKLESYIQENVRSEMERNVIHTQTATMLEIGTNLLSQSAENTRKLTDVETQVLNQTSRLEIQLLENSLSTNRLETQLLEQTQEVSLQYKAHNITIIRHKKYFLTDNTVIIKICTAESFPVEKEMLKFRDCAEILKSGVTESGIYNIHLPNSTQKTKVFCDMKTKGGGWTVFQHRYDGSVDFNRGWNDYKLGFGDPSGEHWLGNDVIHLLTTSKDYTLQQAYSQYDHFYIDGEDKKYSLHASGFSGTAGRTSSLTQSGTLFSTKDQDNDQCSCKCAQMATGGITFTFFLTVYTRTTIMYKYQVFPWQLRK
uniref:Angiopoietin 2b n=1 Tax=Cyprinus carpio TaxID=7962 RepID=A0A8C1U1T9_CYPCA